MAGRRNTAEDVLARYRVDQATGCWIWQGKPKDTGYGQVNFNGRVQSAHKVVYELLRGPVSAGLVLDHTCQLKICVNPAHLDPVAQRLNIHRGSAPSGRATKATECPAGHPYNAENTYVRPDGKGKFCRTCANSRSRSRAHPRRVPLVPCQVQRCQWLGRVTVGLCDHHVACLRRFGTAEPVGLRKHLRQMPGADETCLYKVYGKEGGLLYVGITSNFTSRRYQHARADTEWFPHAAEWKFFWFRNRVGARQAEVAAIREEKPLFNKRHARG